MDINSVTQREARRPKRSLEFGQLHIICVIWAWNICRDKVDLTASLSSQTFTDESCSDWIIEPCDSSFHLSPPITPPYLPSNPSSLLCILPPEKSPLFICRLIITKHVWLRTKAECQPHESRNSISVIHYLTPVAWQTVGRQGTWLRGKKKTTPFPFILEINNNM